MGFKGREVRRVKTGATLWTVAGLDSEHSQHGPEPIQPPKTEG